MKWKDATDALIARFYADWTAAHPTVPVDTPNGKPVSVDTETGAWLRLRFVPAFARNIAVGGKLRMVWGRAVVNVYTPIGIGDGVAAGYDDDVVDIWDGAHAAGLDGAIHLDAPTPLVAVPDRDAPFWRSGVSIPFHFDHTPS